MKYIPVGPLELHPLALLGIMVALLAVGNYATDGGITNPVYGGIEWVKTFGHPTVSVENNFDGSKMNLPKPAEGFAWTMNTSTQEWEQVPVAKKTEGGPNTPPKGSVAEAFSPTGFYQTVDEWQKDGIPLAVTYKNKAYSLVGSEQYNKKTLLKKAEFKALFKGLTDEAFAKDLKVLDRIQGGLTIAFSSTSPIYYQDEDGDKLVPSVDEDREREVFIVSKTTDSLPEDGKKWSEVFGTASAPASKPKTGSQKELANILNDGGLTGESRSSSNPSAPNDGGLT